jgi:TPR repeat protein
MGAIPILAAQALDPSEHDVTKKRVGIAGLIVLMIAIGIWAILPKHGRSPGSAATGPVTQIPAREAQVQPAGTSTRPVTVTTLDLWARPPAKVAARNLRRARFALLKRLGASEQLVDRFTDGDVSAVVAELKRNAQRGDASAGDILAYMAHITCVFASPKVQEAQALPGQDAEWLNAALQEKIVYDKQLSSVCQQAIDRKEANDWLAKSAEQGNGASLWLLSLFATNNLAKLQEAVDVGYPEAQAMLAQRLTNPAPGLSSGEGAENLFKEAAVSLPYAEGLLALCQFSGCPGIAADIPAAVAHAREAAQRGALDAMIQIGPQLQASMIDPNEVAAWSLVGAMLAQQGCSYGAFSVQWLTAATNALTSNSISDKAKSLAEQYWQEFGTQMMSNIGCT